MTRLKTLSSSLFGLLLFAGMTLEAQAKTPDSFQIKRSAKSEVMSALKQSQRDDKYGVLVIFGDDQCEDCMQFLHEVTVERSQTESIFEVVTLPKKAANTGHMGFYPKVTKFPHFYVMTPIGDLLWSQHAGVLKTEDAFDDAKVDKFLYYWHQSAEGNNWVSDRYRVGGPDDVSPPWCGPHPQAPCIRR